MRACARPGVCAIPIKSGMPSYQRWKVEEEIREADKEEAQRLFNIAEDERRMNEGTVEQPDAPEACNEDIVKLTN